MMMTIPQVQSSVLEKESPPPITSNLNFTMTDDTKDIDVEIDVDNMEDDALFENKTQMISTEGADDIDIDGIPPNGVTVVIQNESVIVTKNPVIIEMTDEVHPNIIDELADVAEELSP